MTLYHLRPFPPANPQGKLKQRKPWAPESSMLAFATWWQGMVSDRVRGLWPGYRGYLESQNEHLLWMCLSYLQKQKRCQLSKTSGPLSGLVEKLTLFKHPSPNQWRLVICSFQNIIDPSVVFLQQGDSRRKALLWGIWSPFLVPENIQKGIMKWFLRVFFLTHGHVSEVLKQVLRIKGTQRDGMEQKKQSTQPASQLANPCKCLKPLNRPLESSQPEKNNFPLLAGY